MKSYTFYVKLPQEILDVNYLQIDKLRIDIKAKSERKGLKKVKEMLENMEILNVENRKKTITNEKLEYDLVSILNDFSQDLKILTWFIEQHPNLRGLNLMENFKNFYTRKYNKSLPDSYLQNLIKEVKVSET